MTITPAMYRAVVLGLVEQNLGPGQVFTLIKELDERQADLDFTVRLVSELAESVAEEVAADEHEPPQRMLKYWLHGKPEFLDPDSIVQALATEPPTRIIEIMGRALKQARLMREGIEKADATPCEHKGCGCPDAKIHLDNLTGRGRYNGTSWNTPQGIQRLEKMLANAVEENVMCSVCGHPERNHNRGPAAIPCLPGLGYLVCHACNINHKEK